ncbi:OmpH family outer membrane protein [Rhodospirillaceae bacterium SYSU D60014]|uniref:OmpH family outer membrane protein n=1 Tax=Virgifigura deserti TaxID=2268457 RepID=UPI000E67378D
MKVLIRRTAVLGIALAAVTLMLPALSSAVAQETRTPLVIAVIDVQQIMQESTAARSIQTELERQREAFQAELAEQENALRASDQKLATERAGLSQEEFVQRRQELDQQAAQLRRNVQNRKEQLESLFNSGMGQVRQALLEIVAEIAQSRGITMVLSKSQVVLAANDFDITAEVMQRLNAKLPKVSAAAPQ